jgi:hypothetical protein
MKKLHFHQIDTSMQLLGRHHRHELCKHKNTAIRENIQFKENVARIKHTNKPSNNFEEAGSN